LNFQAGETPLIAASGSGHYDVVKLFVDREGARINSADQVSGIKDKVLLIVKDLGADLCRF